MAENQNAVEEQVVTSATPVADAATQLKSLKGAFVSSLKRNNKEIRDDRALTIAQKAKRSYKRKIEDLMDDINEKKLQRAAMLDLSPNDRNSLILGNDFDADKFVLTDLDLGKQIENQEIVLRIATAQYEYLFDEKVTR